MATKSGAERREIFLATMKAYQNFFLRIIFSLSLIFPRPSTGLFSMSLILPKNLSTVPYRLSLKKNACTYAESNGEIDYT